MKDRNGVLLKHGDFVRVDFVCVNAPMRTCYCQVNMDKLEVVEGKEPATYYTRTLTKVGEPKKEGNRMEERHVPMLQVGDIVGGLYKSTGNDGSSTWILTEDKINKVTQTKRDGWRYYTKSKFRPLNAEEVDRNTKDMEEAVGKGYIITGEVFGLNEKTRPFAERWVEWANKNTDKATSILDFDEDIER